MSTSKYNGEAIRQQIAEALAREQEGRIEQALQVADLACSQAEQSGDRALWLRALVQKARALDGCQTGDARDEAEGVYFQALDIAAADGDALHVAVIWRRLAVLAVRMDPETKRARERCESHAKALAQLADNVAEDAHGYHLRAEIEYREGRYSDAATSVKRAIDLIATTPEQEHALTTEQQIDLSRYRATLAKSLEAQGRLDDAIGMYELAQRSALELPHADMVTLQMNHGLALKKRGKLPRARTKLETALRRVSADHGPTLDAGIIHTFLSDLNYTDGKADEAARHGREALRIYTAVRAPDHRMAEAYTNIANAELKRKDFDAARGWYEKALSLRQRSLGDNDYQLGVTEGSLAEALVGLAQYDEAVDHVARARQILSRHTQRPEAQRWILAVEARMLDGLKRGA